MIDLLISRLQKARPVGKNAYVACCPSHEDKTPSLSVTERNGKVLVYCHAGCTQDEVISAAGLTWDDLFEDDAPNQRAYSSKKPVTPINPLRVDENVLLIVREKLSRGDSLSAEDQARAEIAYERVREAYSA